MVVTEYYKILKTRFVLQALQKEVLSHQPEVQDMNKIVTELRTSTDSGLGDSLSLTQERYNSIQESVRVRQRSYKHHLKSKKSTENVVSMHPIMYIVIFK